MYRIDAQKRPGTDDSARFKLKEADHSLASAKWKARSTLLFGNSSRFRSQDRLSPKYNRFTLSNNQKCFDFAIASTASFPWFPSVHHIRAIGVIRGSA